MAAGWEVFKHDSSKTPIQGKGLPPRNFRLGWIQGKRDSKKEQSLTNWICQVSGSKPPAKDVDFGDWLKDGQVLCNLLNKLFPKLAIRTNTKGEYALRENVSVFLTACQHIGLREEDCFAVNDLWEQKNLAQVVSTLYSIADLAHTVDPRVPLPQ